MPMTLLIIVTLATWRLSSLLSNEEGPFGVFEKFRELVGVRYNQYSEPYGLNGLADGVLCLWCNSVWFSTALVLCCWFAGEVTSWLVPFYALASSAGAIIVSELLAWLEHRSQPS